MQGASSRGYTGRQGKSVGKVERGTGRAYEMDKFVGGIMIIEKEKNYRRQWGKQDVMMGDFLHWLNVNGYTLRFVDEIHRTEEMECFKCAGRKHSAKGWGWVQATSMCHVCDEQIKRDIPPKTENQWDAYGR